MFHQRPWLAFAAALFVLNAAGVGFEEDASLDASWRPALNAIARGDFQTAISMLEGVVTRDPANAEVRNGLGYAYRKRGQLDLAFIQYREALRLAPRHLGAHEYIGEAYVLAGDIAKAREHLAALERLCGRTCDEYRDLEKAIAAFE